MSRFTVTAASCLCAALLDCASTNVDISGSGLREPLCRASTGKLSAQVYWSTQWRPDQKEPALREAAALRGIQDFFASLPCVSRVDIRRLPREPAADRPSDEELLNLVAAALPVPDMVLLIVVRELGPKLLIGMPLLVSGGTEVVIDVRLLDVRTSVPMARVRTHWHNGGAFVIKGVKTLDQDMNAALRATLMSAAPSE